MVITQMQCFLAGQNVSSITWLICGVRLKAGGIIAGHDYITNDESGQNWTVNYDGTIDLTGTVVKGAVDAFAAAVCRQVTVSYRESGFNTWAIRK